MLVTAVEPVIAGNTVLKEFAVNEVPLDLHISYLDIEETTDVDGENLWTASMWMSSDARGSNVLSGTQVEEVLTPTHRNLKRKMFLKYDPNTPNGFKPFSSNLAPNGFGTL